MPQPVQPLRDFLRTVGEAVANVNSTVVGLDAVENGYKKPAGLNISWNPADREAAARKARRFVLDAALVHVAEALYEFVRVTVKLPRFKAMRESWTDKTSRAEKFYYLITETGMESYLAVGATLLIHWRNRVVHPRSRAKLTSHQSEIFKQAATEIKANFADLSVERLLNDFEINQPTLKDISSLVAMSIKVARAIDAAVNVLSNEDLEALLVHYDLKARIALIEAETTPSKRYASVLRLLQSTAPGLVQSYCRLHKGEVPESVCRII